MERRRPTGVTIITVLAIIAGILLLFGGLALVTLAPFISQIKLNDGINTSNNTSISLNVNGTIVTTELSFPFQITHYPQLEDL